MREYIIRAPQMLADALQARLPALSKPEQVVFCGMGGSGISGDIIRDAFAGDLQVPVLAVKSSSLPRFVGPATLLMCISYSGNTWETMELLRQGLERGAQAVCITSGGLLAQTARERGLPLLMVPGGLQPRAALAGLLGSALIALAAAGLLEKKWDALPAFLTGHLIRAEEEGKQLAEKLWGKTIVAYGMREAVVRRFKTQVNENAKLPCRMDVLPELNHNETVGWQGATGGNGVVLFRDPDEPEMLKKSIEFLKTMLAEHATITDIVPEGHTKLERMLFSILVGDFASYYLAVRHGVDIEAVEVIQKLKETIGEKKG